MVAVAACTGVEDPIDFQFSVEEVDVETLPPADPAETYQYRFGTVRADSLIRALLNARIPVNEAWEPVQNTCADPLDPRFTVVLEDPDSRMANNNFDPGNGIVGCTTRVRRYQVTRFIF